MSQSKKVSIHLPSGIGIKLIDHYVECKFYFPYDETLRLTDIRRFPENRMKEWIVYSNDLDRYIDYRKELKEEGIIEGDILEICLCYKEEVLIEYQKNLKKSLRLRRF
jgi:hypothetical protein